MKISEERLLGHGQRGGKKHRGESEELRKGGRGEVPGRSDDEYLGKNKNRVGRKKKSKKTQERRKEEKERGFVSAGYG